MSTPVASHDAPEPTTKALLARLADHTVRPETRQQAALEIGRRADAAVSIRLVQLLWDEPEFFVRETITWALVRMGRDYLPEVAAALGDPRPLVRAQAVHVLSKVGAPEYADAVLPLLDDPSPEVAVKARWMLAQLHDPRLLPRLIAALGQNDPREHDMVDQLLTGYGAAAVTPLCDVIARDTVSRREQAIQVLQSIGSPEANAAVPALRRVVDAAMGRACTPSPGDPDIPVNTASGEELAVTALMTLAQLSCGDAQRVIADTAAASSSHAPMVVAVARRLLAQPPKPTSAARLRALRNRHDR